MMNKLSPLRFLIAVGLLSCGACNWYQASLKNKVVVKVDSNEFNSKQFADELSHRLSKYDALTAKDPKNIELVKNAIINDFILSSILKKWAQDNNIQVSKVQIEDEIAKVRKGFPDDLTFREELSKQGVSLYQWQQSMTERLLEKAAMNHVNKMVPQPTDEEISKHYQLSNKKYFQKERVYLHQIVLATNSDADQVQVALKKNQSFASLAQEFSITPESKKGGEVGWVEKGLLPVFDEAFTLPIGKASDPIQSPYGFHILLVTKKSPEGPIPLSNVHDAIKRELKGQRDQAYFSKWLENQIRSLHVFKDQQLIDAMAVETRKE
ncbi:MAG: parvulin-like peptidyl-prolyl isomerase [Pseudomonadota bacterium]|jgi:parvulin-like peptidyl-prolyl isomerase